MRRKTVKVEFEENGIAWVILNRPEKRNAMSPNLNDDMVDVLEMLETDDRAKVLVLTGAGEAWTAGMDLREFFRALDKETPAEQARQRRSSEVWQFRMLRNYAKPTIAMVNGWCFGGAFTPLACNRARRRSPIPAHLPAITTSWRVLSARATSSWSRRWTS